MDFKASLYDSNGSGITGSSDLKIKIKRDTDDFFFDFDDSIFKNSGWTTIAEAMSDIDIANVPGEYEISVDVSNWNDGIYTVYYVYSGSPSWTSAGEFALADGLEIISATSINAIRDAILDKAVDGAIDVQELLKILTATFAGDMTQSLDALTVTYKDQVGAIKVSEDFSVPNAVSRTIS